MEDKSEQRSFADESTTICEGLEKVCSISAKVDFVDGYENPVAWQKKHKRRSDQSDVLFDNLDMKAITLDQYDMQHDKLPEFIKWKLWVPVDGNNL